jgi:putative ATP-dependent endonuclease of OLD family
VVRAFVSHPTLEPTLVASNEEAIIAAFAAMNVPVTVPVTAELIDWLFQNNQGRKRKGDFALEVAAAFAARHEAGQPVHVPAHIEELFEYLYFAPHGTDSVEDGTDEHLDADDAAPPF